MDTPPSLKWRGRLIRYAPLFLWIAFIFYLSSGQGSFEQTSRFIRPLLEFFFPGTSPESISFYHGIVRKLAHPTVYAVLGYLSIRAFTSLESQKLQRKFVFLSVLLVVCVAALDEFNQSFLSVRTGSIWDVLLDSVGGVLAIGLYILYRRLRSKPEIDSSTVTNASN